MKILKYNLHGNPVGMVWNEANEENARREADNGEYTIEDDGAEETAQPTQEDRLAALEKTVANIPSLIQNAVKEALGR